MDPSIFKIKFGSKMLEMCSSGTSSYHNNLLKNIDNGIYDIIII